MIIIIFITERDFSEFVNPKTVLRPSDIPSEYLKAKYIHICTNYPEAQYELVKYFKENQIAQMTI